MQNQHSKSIKWLFIFVALCSLTGCLHWMRAFQVYLQLDDFDKNFTIDDQNKFVLYFNAPKLYSSDLLALSKLQPSHKKITLNGTRWRYLFRKVNQDQELIQPEISFFFDLDFDSQHRVSAWTFSPLFLDIAPAKFLEASLRSLAGSEIDKSNRQLRAKSQPKIDAELPKKVMVLKNLGQSLKVEDEGEEEVYYYNFLLETSNIEAGYEDRALSVVKLSFDKQTTELTRMAGRFAGLKISIRYHKFLTETILEK